MTTTFEKALAFIPEARVVIHDANTIELRIGVWNCSSVTLSDDEQRGTLGKIVLGLMQRQPGAVIAQKVGVDIEAVNSVIEVLIANNMLVPKESLDQWTPLTYLIAPTLGAARGMTELPKKVILLGSSPITEFFKSTLGSVLVEKVHVEDERELTSLKKKDLRLDADGLAITSAFEPYMRWKDVLLVVLSSELNPIFLGNLNYLAHRIGFRFLPAVVDGPFAMVGPTVTPGNTACFACAEMRVLESLRDHTLYIEYRKALAESKVYGSTTEVTMDPFQASIFSLASWEVLNLMTVGNSFTTNKLLSIYAPTMEIMFHELLHMPGCRVCGKPASLDQPLYSDLRSYLSSQLGKKEKR